jgi:hypothetical protein
MRIRAASLALASAAGALPAAASAAAWEYVAMDGSYATCIAYDAAHRRLLVGTTEGFQEYSFAAAVWTEHVEEGWVGRFVASIATHPARPDRVVTGRMDAFFKGYMEVSDTFDENGVTTHTSTGGYFNSIARDLADPDRLYACSWPDILPGEFLVSADGGSSWTPVAETLHFAMTGIAVDDTGALLLSGDAPMSRSTDGGLTWTQASSGLPPQFGCYFVESTCASSATVPQSTAFTSSDGGLFRSTDRGASWQPLPADTCWCLAIDHGSTGTRAAAASFLGDRVLLSEDAGDTWRDETGGLAGTVVNDLVFAEGYLWAATERHGVFRTPIAPTAAPPLPGLRGPGIVVAPNPFRRTTRVSFDLPAAGTLRAHVFDVAGRRVATIHDAWSTPGKSTFDWDAGDLSAGVYFVRATLGGASSAAAAHRLR